MGEMDPQKVARLLAGRLSAIVPQGFHVEADEAMIWFTADEGRFPGQQGIYQVGPAGMDVGQYSADQVVGMAFDALDYLQDFVDEASHDPWPGKRRPPKPRAEIRGGMLHFWYGEGDDVVLECDPIPVADLMSSG